MQITRQKIMVILLIVLLFAGGVFWLFFRPAQVSPVQTGNGMVLDMDAEDWENQLEGQAEAETSGIKIPGYGTITFPADEKEVQLTLANPEENPCYFQFVIALDETGEILYTSDLIEPGKAIKNLTLARGLEAGEHEAAIQVHTFSLDTQERMNNAVVRTNVSVQ